MIKGEFVFDVVTHLYNMSEANVKNPGGKMFNQHLYAFHSYLTPPGERVLKDVGYGIRMTIASCSWILEDSKLG